MIFLTRFIPERAPVPSRKIATVVLAPLYLDNHLLVVNKPPGLLAQADRTGDPDLLSLGKAYLKERYDKPGNVFLGLVHRIDRPASGVMVFARTSKAAARLADQFRNRTTEKRYLALVEGLWEGEGLCEDYLVKDHRRVRVVAPERTGAKRAVLRYRVAAARGDRSLVVVDLETGRPHQIRVQLAHRGHPLVGDFRYGGSQAFDGRNLALHAFRLAVDHPTQRTRMAWQAPPMGWGPHFQAEIDAVLDAARGGPRGVWAPGDGYS